MTAKVIHVGFVTDQLVRLMSKKPKVIAARQAVIVNEPSSVSCIPIFITLDYKTPEKNTCTEYKVLGYLGKLTTGISINELHYKRNETYSLPVYIQKRIKSKKIKPDCRTCIYHGHGLSGITKLNLMKPTDDSITLKVNQVMVCKNVSDVKCVDGSKYVMSNPIQLYNLGNTQHSKR